MNDKKQNGSLNVLINYYHFILDNKHIFVQASILSDMDVERIDAFYISNLAKLIDIRSALIDSNHEKANSLISDLHLPNSQTSIVKQVVKYYCSNQDIQYDINYGLDEVINFKSLNSDNIIVSESNLENSNEHLAKIICDSFKEYVYSEIIKPLSDINKQNMAFNENIEGIIDRVISQQLKSMDDNISSYTTDIKKVDVLLTEIFESLCTEVKSEIAKIISDQLKTDKGAFAIIENASHDIKSGLIEITNKLESLQKDPIKIIEQNHELSKKLIQTLINDTEVRVKSLNKSIEDNIVNSIQQTIEGAFEDKIKHLNSQVNTINSNMLNYKKSNRISLAYMTCIFTIVSLIISFIISKNVVNTLTNSNTQQSHNIFKK